MTKLKGFKLYEVGGCVRDELLGLKSDDIDFTVVLEDSKGILLQEGFKRMKKLLKDQGFQIFLSTPEMVTIRAKFPLGHKNEGLVADFVLSRKEVGYKEGTREPILELGNLKDDLIRRDFTVNALAKDEDGNIIDMFKGIEDLKRKSLLTPLNPNITMLDDPLRFLRALRFSITKDMTISIDIFNAINDNPEILNKLNKVVSQERIQSELNKMLKFDTLRTVRILSDWDRDLNGELLPILFKNGFYLQMTNKKK